MRKRSLTVRLQVELTKEEKQAIDDFWLRSGSQAGPRRLESYCDAAHWSKSVPPMWRTEALRSSLRRRGRVVGGGVIAWADGGVYLTLSGRS